MSGASRRIGPGVTGLALFPAGGALADSEIVSAGGLEPGIARDARLRSSGARDAGSTFRLHRDGGPLGSADAAASGTSYTDRNATSGATRACAVHTLDAVGSESGVRNVVSPTLGGKSAGRDGAGGSGSGAGRGGGKGKNK